MKENRDIEAVQELRSRIPDLLAVYRFGSSVSGTETAQSDLDFAFLARRPVPPLERWDLQQAMASLLGTDVDLIDLLQASTVLCLQVIVHGVRLYCASEGDVGEFEDRVFSAYCRLNEERRGILEDILRRGSIYGR